MYKVLIATYLAFFSSLLVAQEKAFRVGETAIVFALNGLKLRENPTAKSDSLTILPYGAKAKVVDITYETFVIEHRLGRWVKVNYKDKTGYLFTGYLTNLPLPKIDWKKHNCIDEVSFSQWITQIQKKDTVVHESERLLMGYDEDGKDASRPWWFFYNDGTMIYHHFGYESETYVVETFELVLNDVLNYLEYYRWALEKNCQNHNYYQPFDIKVIENTWDKSVKEIYCEKLGNFTAKRVGGRLACSFNVY